MAKMMTTNDLDLVRLIGELGPRYAAPDKPALMPKDDAVRVLAEFRDADELTTLPTSGEDLWFGKTYDVHADANSFEGFVFVRIKAQPPDATLLKRAGVDAAVALPYLAFASGLVVDGWQEEGDAKNIVNELQTGAPVKPSRGYHYMKESAPSDGYFPLAKTEGKSKLLCAPSPRWLRQKGNRLLLVERSSPTSAAPYPAAGSYAELWRIP